MNGNPWTAGISIASIVAITGWFVAHRLTISRERSRDQDNRKRGFVAFAQMLISEIDQTSNEKFIEWCRQATSKVAGECASVQPDIPKNSLRQFRDLRDAFCNTKPPDIEDPKKDLPKMAAQLTTYDKGRERMRDLLEKMIGCIK